MKDLRLSPHFLLSEFACHDEANTPVPAEYIVNVRTLALQLEVVRAYFKAPVNVLSGYRTAAWNRHEGGARYSQHMVAKAADIDVQGVNPRVVADFISEAIADGRMLKGGLGRYTGWTHYDIRGRNARWSSL